MTLEEYIQFLKDNRQKVKPPLLEDIVKDFEKAVAHTRGIHLDSILKGYRKSESPIDLKRRAELLEPVTKDIFDRTTSDLIEVLSPDLVNIEADDDVRKYLDSIGYVPFLQEDVISNMLDDPNGLLVAMPKVKSKNGSEYPDIEFWIVNYKDVFNDFHADGFLVFKKDIPNTETLEDDTFYYFVSKAEVGRFYEGKDGFVRDEKYYVNLGGESEIPLFIQLGGKLARNEDNKKFYQSYYHAALAHATMALRIHSDKEATRMRANLMIAALKMPCDTCNGTKDLYDPEKEEYVKCTSCNGTGNKSMKWNIGDAIEFNSDDFEIDKLDNLFKFIDPPKEGVMMQHELANDHLLKTEKALNMLFLDQAQSGVAKEIDKEHHTAMINTIAKNIYGRLVKWMFQVVSERRSKKPKDVSVIVPSDFREITPSSIMEQINELKEKGGTSGLLYPLFRRLYNTMYNNDAVSLKIALYSLENDPLHMHNRIQDKRLAAMDDKEFEYSKQLPAALQKLAFKETKKFLDMTDEKIESELKGMIKLPEIVPILNNNGVPPITR